MDICIQPVPKKNVTAYRKTTKIVGQLLVKHGAISSSDYIADDKNATSLSFPKKIKVKPSEVLIIAMAEFKSASHRKSVFNLMMKDPKMAKLNIEPSWMDNDNAIFGGFKLLVAVK